MATQSRNDSPNKSRNVSMSVNGWSLNTNSHKWKVHIVVESWQTIPKYGKVKARWKNDKEGLWNKALCKEYVVYNHFAHYWLEKTTIIKCQEYQNEHQHMPLSIKQSLNRSNEHYVVILDEWQVIVTCTSMDGYICVMQIFLGCGCGLDI
jgi:hypothetical protein